jgi:hypothetical protein
MSVPGGEVTSMPGAHRIAADIQDMVCRYGQTFIELVVGKRSDTDALLDFYGAPLRFVGANFHLVMKDDAAVAGPQGMGGEIERLRQADLAESTLDNCEVNLLNERAVLVDAVWVRRDSRGALIARIAVKYLVTLVAEGWRITSMIDTSVGVLR